MRFTHVILLVTNKGGTTVCQGPTVESVRVSISVPFSLIECSTPELGPVTVKNLKPKSDNARIGRKRVHRERSWAHRRPTAQIVEGSTHV